MTDTERREVARRLRSFVTDDSMYATVDVSRVLYALGLYYADIDRIYFHGYDVARLADLIESSEPKVRCVAEVKVDGERLEKLAHDAVVEVTGIDRDALLALADGLDKDADNIISAARNAQFTGSGPRMEEAKHDAYDWRQIASRIRKALGVDDG